MAKKKVTKKTANKVCRKSKKSNTNEHQQQPEAHWLNQAQMAKSCGISPQAFRNWGVEPVAKIGPSVYFSVAAVLKNRISLLEEKHRNQATSLTDQELSRKEREEKLRLTSAQAEGQEIKNEQLKAELAPVSVIEWVVSKAGSQISAVLDALPLKLKKRNQKLTAQDMELIKREIVKTQNAAARMNVDLDEYYEHAGAPD